jgi:hypothetical protein
VSRRVYRLGMNRGSLDRMKFGTFRGCLAPLALGIMACNSAASSSTASATQPDAQAGMDASSDVTEASVKPDATVDADAAVDADADACVGATGLVISGPLTLDKQVVEAGQKLSGTATYKNCTGAAVSPQQLLITARPPGGTHAGGPYDDFAPALGPVTVAAGGTIVVSASRDFTALDPTGQWVSYVTWQDEDATWHDGPDVAFEVKAPLAPSGTYPTGVALRGVNRAGMEYGDDWDGWTGQTYFEMPPASQTASELAYFKSKGMNVIRLPISWERVQHTLNGSLTSSYVSGMMDYIDAATAQGFHVVLDLHNYNRYAENTHNASGDQVGGYTQRILGDGVLTLAHLTDIWVKLANLVLDNPKLILNVMNEPHDFPLTSTEWFAGVQTVMDAIRATGAQHLILVPNSRASDVDHWSTYAPNGGPVDAVAALAITDSANNYAFDMHAYQTYPSSAGSYADLVSEVTDWAKTNHKRLFLSELGVAGDAGQGSAAVGGLLSYLNTNNDVWMGWTPWDLAPYSITNDAHTADAPPMSWYDPYLVPDFLGQP